MTVPDKIFKDKNGHVVLWQTPNLLLITWAICEVVQKFVTIGWVYKTASIAGFMAIGLWAILEIGWGANYFRRALGLIVLIASIIARLR